MNTTNNKRYATFEDLTQPSVSIQRPHYCVGLAVAVAIVVSDWGQNYVRFTEKNATVTKVRSILRKMDRTDRFYCEALDLYLSGEIKELLAADGKYEFDELVTNKQLNRAIGRFASRMRTARKETQEKAAAQNPAQFFFLSEGAPIRGFHAKVIEAKELRGEQKRSYYYTSQPEYETYALIKFQNDYGHTLVWSSSTERALKLKTGDKLMFTKGSVQKHDFYRNVAQTKITRVDYELKN